MTGPRLYAQDQSDVTRGRRAPDETTTVYVSNKGGFDVEGAMAWAGDKAKVPMVFLLEGSLGRNGVASAETSIADKLRFFNPETDILMVAGRALVNLLVGACFQSIFPGATIKLLTWDARLSEYDLSEWTIDDTTPLDTEI